MDRRNANPPRCPNRFKAHKQYQLLPPHALYPLWDSVHVVSPEEMEILRKTKVKPDLFWRQQGLIVEYDGRQHENEQQSKADALRITILEGKGYTVRRIMRHQLYNPLAFDNFARSLGSFLGVRLRPTTPKHQLARLELRYELLIMRQCSPTTGQANTFIPETE